MLGVLKEYFNIYKYPHEYSKIREHNTFHVYKPSGYHLYDFIVFVIILVFLGAYFNTIYNSFEEKSIGYILIVTSIIAICAMLY